MMLPRCSVHSAPRQGVRRTQVVLRASSSNGAQPTQKHVVVIGGTGRVGSSTAAALLALDPSLKVSIASRSRASYDAAVLRRPELAGVPFKECDISSLSSVQAAIADVDLVIHTAGPFQRLQNYTILEAALSAKIAYLDVCDDSTFAEGAKTKFHDMAVAAGVPAITSAGIYPGTSNVMAAHIISIARREYDENWQYRQPAEDEGVQPKLLRYSYYTAGSGGAGQTILETSFLLAGEECVVWKEGERFVLPPISNRREVDFGTGVGRKGVYLYHLPEVDSAHKYLQVPGVSARFGTDPFIWNWAMWLLARLVPRRLLNDRTFVKWFAALSDPWVRIVDKIVGETVAMRIEVDFEGGQAAAGLFTHKKLSQSMGYSVAAFAKAMLAGQTKPGVWFPEEKEALSDRRAFLQLAATGTDRFDLNRPAWELESEIKQIGGMVYW